MNGKITLASQMAGRIKIDIAEKRVTKAVSLSKENIEKLKDYHVENVSKFVDWLLKEHFGKLIEGGQDGQ